MSLLATAALALSMMQGADMPATPPAAEPTARRRPSFLNTLKRWMPDKTQRPLTNYRGDRIRTQKWSQGDWIIEVKKDGFADRIQCRVRPQQSLLSKARVTYASGLMGFRFKGNAQPSQVWYRVGDQPAKPWRSLFRELHARGHTVMPYNADFREDTVILIPVEEMQGASTVAVRPSEKGKPDNFDISGFIDALEASRRVGCTDDSYVREEFD